MRSCTARIRLQSVWWLPGCTSHSKSLAAQAKIEDQKACPRLGCDSVGARKLYIDNIIIENVPEFIRWGPLGATASLLKSKVGET